MAKRSYELSEAISRLIHAQPFFAVLLMDLLEIVEGDMGGAVPTAATNGKKLYVNPAWFNPLDLDERIFVLRGASEQELSTAENPVLHMVLRAAMALSYARLGRAGATEGEPDAVELDPALSHQLEKLGYILK